MTYEDLDYCNDLVEKIKNIKRKVEKIDAFSDRLNQITGPCAGEVKIKLDEGYQNTPVICVNKNLFFDLVELTRNDCKNKIKELEQSLKNYNSNNAVEIVRCKDCSNFMSCNRTEGPDWFCPKGK